LGIACWKGKVGRRDVFAIFPSNKGRGRSKKSSGVFIQKLALFRLTQENE